MYTLLASLSIILATTTDPVVEVSPRHVCAELSDELWAAVERGELTENQSADIALRCWLSETSRGLLTSRSL